MNNHSASEIPTAGENSNPSNPEQAPKAEQPPLEQPIPQQQPQNFETITPQSASESWSFGDTFKASDFGWNSNQMGWLGDKVYLTDYGGNNGILQGNFFTELSRLVTKEQLMGQESGNIVNQFLRAAYRGMNPTEAAGKAAELLLGK